MPGLIGFAGRFAVPPEQLLDRMAQVSLGHSRFEVHKEIGPGFGFEQISLDIDFANNPPVWNEEKTLCLMMDGEVFGYGPLKQKLIEQGHRFRSHGVSELVLHLFEEVGEQFPSLLNGTFVIAIWDQRASKLLLVNDRLGFYPLYYVNWNGNLAFSPNVQALLSDPSLPRKVDPISIAQFLTFDHVLGDRTILQNVCMLPPASILTFSESKFKLQSYWTLKFSEHHQPACEADLLEILTSHLRQAVARQTPGEQTAGLLLSGGLDSRILLALLAEKAKPDQIVSFTFGIPGCDDARFAQEASAAVDIRHFFLELKPDYLLEAAEEGVRLTSGLGNCVHMGALATLDDETKHVSLLYKGFFGDALMGFFSRREFYGYYNEDDLVQLLFCHYPINFHLSEHSALFTEEFQGAVQDAVIESCRAALANSADHLAVNQMYHFDIHHRQRRLTLNGVQLARSRAVVRIPFCDAELVDFMLSLPPGLRLERSLVKKAFVKSFPGLGKVPITETGLPMISCARNIFIQAEELVNWHLRSRGSKGLFPGKRRPYKDYNRWFRTVLRGWIEETLLNKRALQRSYFNPAYIRQLVSDHMSGANYALKLGALLSLELWHRQYVD